MLESFIFQEMKQKLPSIFGLKSQKGFIMQVQENVRTAFVGFKINSEISLHKSFIDIHESHISSSMKLNNVEIKLVVFHS